MPATSFTATPAERENVAVLPRPCATNATPIEARCTECDQLKAQISVLNRTVDDLTDRHHRAHMAFNDLEAEMRNLRNSTNAERSTAAHAEGQLRVERDILQGRLDEVSKHIKPTDASIYETHPEADAYQGPGREEFT